ncbi:hypothetical protein QR685DRAFT_310623 [Neurospora intermedia]|uniref:Uncharacterized protein n=1 Tax=Neurospora intermedia TaxID=5142 RepID=A0ABR3D7M7_NEUIN
MKELISVHLAPYLFEKSSHIRAATPFLDLPYRETRTDRVINYENELLLMAPLGEI